MNATNKLHKDLEDIFKVPVAQASSLDHGTLLALKVKLSAEGAALEKSWIDSLKEQGWRDVARTAHLETAATEDSASDAAGGGDTDDDMI